MSTAEEIVRTEFERAYAVYDEDEPGTDIRMVCNMFVHLNPILNLF